jgi:signal transduction histidine kinase
MPQPNNFKGFLARLAIPIPNTLGGAGLVWGRDKLQQVFINLLGNAFEASPEGVVVRVEVTRIDERAVRVQVHNAGEPIPSQALSRLTEPFYSTKAKGTGLGLAIVQGIVEAHEGGLEIASSARQGTRVSVTLPSLAERGE